VAAVAVAARRQWQPAAARGRRQWRPATAEGVVVAGTFDGGGSVAGFGGGNGRRRGDGEREM